MTIYFLALPSCPLAETIDGEKEAGRETETATQGVAGEDTETKEEGALAVPVVPAERIVDVEDAVSYLLLHIQSLY